MPRKILVLSHEFPPLGGGGGRILASLCEELYRRGIETTVLTAAPPVEIRIPFSFPVVYFPTFRRERFKTNVPAMMLFIAQALWYCLRRRPRGFDILFSNMAIPAGIAGIVLRSYLRLPHVIWYHNTEVTQNRPRGAGPLFRTACRFIGGRAEANLFVSAGLMNLALTYGHFPRPGVLPNATRVHQTSCRPYASREKLFLFAARMERVKNPMLLLDAVQIILARKPGTRLQFLIVGSGEIFQQVRNSIARRWLSSLVSLRHAATFEEMAGLYDVAYAHVLPSLVEGYPTTVLEAGARGVPTIASDTIGNRDAVIHEKTGLLFPLDSADSLADAILRLDDDADLRNRLGQGALERSRQFTIGNTAEAFLKATEEL